MTKINIKVTINKLGGPLGDNLLKVTNEREMSRYYLCAPKCLLNYDVYSQTLSSDNQIIQDAIDYVMKDYNILFVQGDNGNWFTPRLKQRKILEVALASKRKIIDFNQHQVRVTIEKLDGPLGNNLIKVTNEFNIIRFYLFGQKDLLWYDQGSGTVTSSDKDIQDAIDYVMAR